MSTFFSAYLKETKPGVFEHWCPGCGKAHTLNVDSSNPGRVYLWNGNPDNPTFQPTVLLEEGDNICHYSIKSSYIHYTQKCTHKLKGKSIILPFFPEK